VAAFPALKTGAIGQYPLERMTAFSTAIFRFLDGGEQRLPRYANRLRWWKIDLSLLDESELTALSDFFVAQGGRSGTFSFTDPWDGTVYSNCSFDADQAVFSFTAAARGETSVTVKENRIG
jgi:hypothetical protein